MATIYVPVCDKDLYFASATIASIRTYCPISTKIIVIPDNIKDVQFLQKMCESFNVLLLHKNSVPLDLMPFYGGWGLSKILPFFLPNDESFICVDADCVVVGDITIYLESIINKSIDIITDYHGYLDGFPTLDAFFDVSHNFFSCLPTPPHSLYERCFVSGIFMSKKGILEYSLLSQLYDLSRQKNSPLFPGDQGILNAFLLAGEESLGIRWSSLPIQLFPSQLCSSFSETRDFSLNSKEIQNFKEIQIEIAKKLSNLSSSQIQSKPMNIGMPFVIHYAGPWKPYFLSNLPGVSQLLNKYRHIAYRKMKRQFFGSSVIAMMADDIKVNGLIGVKQIISESLTNLKFFSAFSVITRIVFEFIRNSK